MESADLIAVMGRHIKKVTGRIHGSSQRASGDGVGQGDLVQRSGVFVHLKRRDGVTRRTAHGVKKSALGIKG